MNVSHALKRISSTGSIEVRKHTSWFASPLDLKVESTTAARTEHRESKMNVDTRVLEFDENRLHRNRSKIPIFKHHTESSTVELFYDLFFVANLSTFTSNHEILDATCM